jgi:hypothetical protein
MHSVLKALVVATFVAMTAGSPDAQSGSTPLPSVPRVAPAFAPVNINSAADVQLLVDAAQKAGVDPGLVVRIAAFESRGVNSKARAPTGSAYGYGQFIDTTWNETVNKYGSKYGISKSGSLSVAETNDPAIRDNKAVQAAMLAEFTRENIQRARSFGGTSPQADFYAMHNLGSSGGPKFLAALRDNPDARVDAVLSQRVISGNSGLYGDGSISIQDAYDRMDKHLWSYSKYTVPYYLAHPNKYPIQAFDLPGGVSLSKAAAASMALDVDVDSVFVENGRIVFSGRSGTGRTVDTALFMTSLRLACEEQDPYFSLDPDDGRAWSDEGKRASKELFDVIESDLRLDGKNWGKHLRSGLRFTSVSARRDYPVQWASIASRYKNLRTRLVFKPKWLSQTRFGEILYKGDVLLKELSGGVPTIDPKEKDLRAGRVDGYLSAKWRRAGENLLISVDNGVKQGSNHDGNRFWFDLVKRAKSRSRSMLDDDPVFEKPYQPKTDLGRKLKGEIDRAARARDTQAQQLFRQVSARGNAFDLSGVKPTMFVIGHDNRTGKDVNGDDMFELAVADDVNGRMDEYAAAYKELAQLTEIFRLYVAAIAVVKRGANGDVCPSLINMPLQPSEKVKSALPEYHPSEMFYTIASYKVDKPDKGWSSWWAMSSSHSGGVSPSGLELYQSAKIASTPVIESVRSDLVGHRGAETWVNKSGRKYVALLLDSPAPGSAPVVQGPNGVPSPAPPAAPPQRGKGMLDDVDENAKGVVVVH